MPPSLISVNLLICEKILAEGDGVLSAIRLVDLFYFTPQADTPIEKQVASMNLLAMGKFPVDDDADHVLEVQVIRPDGTIRDIGSGPDTVSKSLVSAKIPDAPWGFNIVAPLVITASQLGLHYAILKIDGQEVARAVFTLTLRESPVANPQN